LDLAVNVAQSSECRMKHGAVVVRGGSVISVGINKNRNHPTVVSSEHIKTHCSVHAEIDALRKVKNAKGATIYVARVNRKGQDRLSRPCDRCHDAIRDAGIRKVVYT
jgi:deoxycytidylate deaminase